MKSSLLGSFFNYLSSILKFRDLKISDNCGSARSHLPVAGALKKRVTELAQEFGLSVEYIGKGKNLPHTIKVSIKENNPTVVDTAQNVDNPKCLATITPMGCFVSVGTTNPENFSVEKFMKDFFSGKIETRFSVTTPTSEELFGNSNKAQS